ncbi:hypothetical protein Q5P01_006482 [Channa striata]|uniref:Uncharacterized protein n=1 Tax=Channa striata TaxID=64152 RepID=A0AA88N830_CHASR|nr:hypothetical protein Q5P01_006482 [Channa striata]
MMKAPARAAHRVPAQMKRKVRAYSALIYRAHKEVSPGRMRSSTLLTGQFTVPRPVVLRLVSSEASLLSRSNRRKVITVKEIGTAVTLVQQKISTRAAA